MSPLPWLHRVSLNLCYSRLDRRRLEAEPIDEADGADLPRRRAEPAERAEQQELRLIVRDGIAALPQKHQSVVVLYYLHGLSLQETADVARHPARDGQVAPPLRASEPARATSRATGASASAYLAGHGRRGAGGRDRVIDAFRRPAPIIARR